MEASNVNGTGKEKIKIGISELAPLVKNKKIIQFKPIAPPKLLQGLPHDDLYEGLVNNVQVVGTYRGGQDPFKLRSPEEAMSNIWALRILGVNHLIGAHVCSLLKPTYKIGQFFLPRECIDRTTEKYSFQNMGWIKKPEVSLAPAYPAFSRRTRHILYKAGESQYPPVLPAGLVVCVDGPRLPTKAESRLYQSWNADAVTFSVQPECHLARELGMLYTCICMGTDYGFWSDHYRWTISQVMTAQHFCYQDVANLIYNAVPNIMSRSFDKELKQLHCDLTFKT